ncbi:MAG: hypothetical protein K0S75_2612 [Clostridia bacterium]|nr:hypothetical protein [Clostridia bacterium]
MKLMILLICIVLIISFFDLSAMIKNRQQSDIICFIIIAVGTVLYGYYYNTHIYTASLIGFVLKLLQVQ